MTVPCLDGGWLAQRSVAKRHVPVHLPFALPAVALPAVLQRDKDICLIIKTMC